MPPGHGGYEFKTRAPMSVYVYICLHLHGMTPYQPCLLGSLRYGLAATAGGQMDAHEDPGPGGGDGFTLNGARTRIRVDAPREVSGAADSGDASESHRLSAREAEVM